MKVRIELDDDQVEDITRKGLKDAIENLCYVEDINPKIEDIKKLKKRNPDAYKDYKALTRAYDFFGGNL